MPFVFVVIGILFLVTAIRGTQGAMFTLLKSEFVGSNSFVPWAAAIFILGALGYSKTVRPVADAMIGLVFLAMILANKGGFFSQLNNQLRNPVAPATPAATPAAPLDNWLPAQQLTQQNPGTPGVNYAPGVSY